MSSRATRVSPLEVLVRYRESVVVIFIVMLVVFFSISASNFFSITDWQDILSDTAIVAVVAAGETFVVITRNIDISVGSAVGFTAYLTARTLASHPGVPITLVALLALGIGLAIGLVNGFLVAVLQIPSIIVTLAMLGIVRGLDVLVTNGQSVESFQLPHSLLNLAGDYVFGIPLLFVVALAVVVLCSIFLRYTRWARELYLIGSNPSAARVAGVPVTSRIFIAFALSGTFAGLGGFMFAAQYGSVDATAATGFEFVVVTAVIVGGVKLFGGAGTAIGAALGALLVVIVQDGFILLKVSEFWEQFLDGVAIVAAVTFDAVVVRKLGDSLRKRRPVSGAQLADAVPGTTGMAGQP